MLSEPAYRTSTTLTYLASSIPPHEVELRPGQKICFVLPNADQGRILRNITLVHRKDAKYSSSVVRTATGYWDNEGAYVAVRVQDLRGTWHPYPQAKFAEPRALSEPEHEGLHDWQSFAGLVPVAQVEIENVSPSSHTRAIACVKSVQIEHFPEGVSLGVQEEVFTQGTSFVNLTAGIMLPTYGGGYATDASDPKVLSRLKTKGLYPDALCIGGKRPATGTVGQYCTISADGKLRISLPAGMLLRGFELSCGDTYYDPAVPMDQQKNKDGHYGSLGNAKIFAKINREQQYFLHNVNVPPAGVLSGGPLHARYAIQANDEIVVESRHHATWVMAYRVTFLQP